MLPATVESSLLTCTVAVFSLDIQNASSGGFASGVLPDCKKSFYNMKICPSLIVKNRVKWKVMVETLCLARGIEDKISPVNISVAFCEVTRRWQYHHG